MKTLNYCCLALGIAILLLFSCKSEDVTDGTTTALVIQNNTNSDVTVGLVLAALGGACPSSKPPVTADQLANLGFCTNVENSVNAPYAGKCKFVLAANSSKTFPELPNTCLSGNVTFGDYPACPDATYPMGYTTAEFTLNVATGDEDIDVSLVNGYNFQVNMTTSGGGGWSYGPNSTAATQIVPKAIGQNIGNPGVFPQNCTDCIQLVNNPVCTGFSPTPTCQDSRICCLRRDISGQGGTVTITLEN